MDRPSNRTYYHGNRRGSCSPQGRRLTRGFPAMIRQAGPHFWLAAFYALILALAPSASAQWNEQVLYSFQGGRDGATPTGGMVFDRQGNLYGATRSGASTSCLGPFGC